MGIKIAVDNNFFDNYFACADVRIKDRVKNAIVKKRISFYPTIELLSELVGLIKTDRHKLLLDYAAFFNEILGYRYFQPWNNIIRIELGLENGSFYLDNTTINNIKEFLTILSKGQIPEALSPILKWVDDNKNSDFQFYRETKDIGVQYLKEKSRKEDIKKINSLEMQEIYKMELVRQWSKSILKDVFAKSGKVYSDKIGEDVLSQENRYPYTNIYLKLTLALNHHHVFLNRRVDFGDSYDKYQLFYLVGLNYLISDDKRARKIGKHVYGRDVVLTFDEFVKLIPA